ncbi:ABC transporter ATP-binding protein [Salinicoccus albus]|uniref:ABC transporter ATP-binding protein n=1 Tax=Salinicoccus albus TaxID=418756 RepID=UPI00037DBAC7|nr:ATP-binding cassette domain-containing protein [Salinicoccus albus]
MERIITIEDMHWQRNREGILKSVNWKVEKGQHWAILGLNGSGKTSLLNVITGYNYPTSGRVNVLNNEFGKSSLPEMRKKIGYVSSSLGRFASTMNREMTENIIVSGKYASFGLYHEVAEEDWHRAYRIMEEMKLSYLQGKTYDRLSQGEQRKVLIGRALMSRPQLLILDEPCAGLDILAREDVLNMTERVAQDSCHILYVTHHIEEITESISHVLLMSDGEIAAKGPKSEVLADNTLSSAFKIPLKVHWEAGRPWMAIRK